jgi:enoyl-[acyl-carrier protein] reductase I
MSVNVRKGNHYTNQNYEYTEKGWNVSAAFHKVMQVLYKKDAMWGVLPYRIWQRSAFSDYNDMDNKAYLESVARMDTFFEGQKVRVTIPNHQRLKAGQAVKGF